MGRERMSHDVRAEGAANAGTPPVRFENLPEAHPSERTTAPIHKQPPRCRLPTAGGQRGISAALILAEPDRRPFPHGNEALLVALADAGQVFLIESQISGAHVHQL